MEQNKNVLAQVLDEAIVESDAKAAVEKPADEAPQTNAKKSDKIKAQTLNKHSHKKFDKFSKGK